MACTRDHVRLTATAHRSQRTGHSAQAKAHIHIHCRKLARLAVVDEPARTHTPRLQRGERVRPSVTQAPTRGSRHSWVTSLVGHVTRGSRHSTGSRHSWVTSLVGHATRRGHVVTRGSRHSWVTSLVSPTPVLCRMVEHELWRVRVPWLGRRRAVGLMSDVTADRGRIGGGRRKIRLNPGRARAAAPRASRSLVTTCREII